MVRFRSAVPDAVVGQDVLAILAREVSEAGATVRGLVCAERLRPRGLPAENCGAGVTRQGAARNDRPALARHAAASTAACAAHALAGRLTDRRPGPVS